MGTGKVSTEDQDLQYDVIFISLVGKTNNLALSCL